MRCLVSWNLGEGTGRPHWLVEAEAAADAKWMMENLTKTRDDAEDENEEGTASRRDWAVDVTETRLEAAKLAITKTHSLRLVFLTDKPKSYALSWRTGQTVVRWESPLVAAQRAEGFILVERPNIEDSATVFRCSPLDIQDAVVKIVASCINRGRLVKSDDGLLPLPVPLEEQAAAAGSDEKAAALDLAAKQHWAAYQTATAPVLAQRRRLLDARVGPGEEAEPWTRAEKFQRYGKLKHAAHQIRDKTLSRITALNREKIKALAERESEGDDIDPASALIEPPANLHELSRCELLSEQERMVVLAVIEGHADLYGSESAEERREGEEASKAEDDAEGSKNEGGEEKEEAEAEIAALRKQVAEEFNVLSGVMATLSSQTALLLRRIDGEANSAKPEAATTGDGQDGLAMSAAPSTATTAAAAKGASIASAMSVLQRHAASHSHHEGHEGHDHSGPVEHGCCAVGEEGSAQAALAAAPAGPATLTPQQKVLALLHRGKMEAAATAGIRVKPLSGLPAPLKSDDDET